MKFSRVGVIICLLLQASSNSFTIRAFTTDSHHLSKSSLQGTTTLFAKKRAGGKSGSSSGGRSGGGGGFGGFSNMSTEKTYGEEAKKSSVAEQGLIDVEGAMSEFFNSNAEWSPLFRSMASSSSVPAMDFLQGTHGEEIAFVGDGDPWKELTDKPTDTNHMKILETFLDSMQQSLIDIPVNEGVKEDDDDLHFLEEGRRLLAIQRFHVLQDNAGGSGIQGYDSLFSTCWSELAYLHINNDVNTGSLIVLPEYDLSDLRRFTDMNLLRPLDWLGMSHCIEVASMRRSVPALRIIYKLQDMPTDSYNEQ